MPTSVRAFSPSDMYGIARYVNGIFQFKMQIESHDCKVENCKTFGEFIN